MKIRRTFTLLFVVIMLFSFTACNGTNENKYAGYWKPVSFKIDENVYTLKQLQNEQKTQKPEDKKVDDGFRITLEENDIATIRVSNDENVAKEKREEKTTWTVIEGNDSTSDKIKVNGKECSLENDQLIYQFDDTTVVTLEKVDVVFSSFAIMGKGMLGIFATVIIVMIVVFILSKTSKKKDA